MEAIVCRLCKFLQEAKVRETLVSLTFMKRPSFIPLN